MSNPRNTCGSGSNHSSRRCRSKHEQPVVNANPENVKLYEERLLIDKEREKTGEVALGKHVETETARASVPLEKERVVIEPFAFSDRLRVGDPFV